jgi:hypothetical protein
MTGMRGTAEAERTVVIRRLRKLLELSPWLGGAAVAAALVVAFAVSGVFGGLFHSHHARVAQIQLKDTESSWVPGQPSLASYPAFMAVAARADALAHQRFAARVALVARLAAEKKARQARARKLALERYEARRRAALARYRAALRRNAEQRRKALEKQRRARAKYLAALKRYHQQLIVRPGQECNLPGVRQQYSCHSGLLPHKPIKHGAG